MINLNDDLSVLDFPIRLQNLLLSENIKTVFDLVQCDEFTLLHIPNLGSKSILYIKLGLANHGLKLSEYKLKNVY